MNKEIDDKVATIRETIKEIFYGNNHVVIHPIDKSLFETQMSIIDDAAREIAIINFRENLQGEE